MTSSSEAPSARAAPATGPDATQRLMKIVVVVLGMLLVAGLLVVVGTIAWRLFARASSSSVAQTPATAVQPGQPAGAATALSAGLRLALPAGAEVTALSLAGDRLAVSYRGPAGAGIDVLDLASGRVIARIGLE